MTRGTAVSIQPGSETFNIIDKAIGAAIRRLSNMGMPFSKEDARQTAWLKVLESWHRYCPERGCGEFSYAYTIAKRAVANYATWSSVPVTLTKRAVEGGGAALDPLRRVTSADHALDQEGGDRGPEAESLEAEIMYYRSTILDQGREVIDRFLGDMPPKEGAMIRLVLDEGVTPKEAAQRVGLRIWHPAVHRIVSMASVDLDVACVSVKLKALEA